MLAFLFGKIVNNKWLMLCLLAGNILLVGLVSVVPIYAQATLQRLLLRGIEARQLELDRYPGLLELQFIFNTVDVEKKLEPELALSEYLRARDAYSDMVAAYGIPVFYDTEIISMNSQHFLTENRQELLKKPTNVIVTAYSGIEEHVFIKQGRMFSPEPVNDVIECIASVNVNKNNFEMTDILLNDDLVLVGTEYNGKPVRLKVVGYFESKYDNDYYWNQSPDTLTGQVIIPYEVMIKRFVDAYDESYAISTVMRSTVDCSQISVRDTDRYLNLNADFMRLFTVRYKADFIPIIEDFNTISSKLFITICILQIPLLFMLLFFVFMVSKQIFALEQNDISVIKSRGASRAQIITVYFLQSIAVCVCAIFAGIPIGVFLCRFIGSSNGFLELVSRAALDTRINPEAIYISVTACTLSMFMMLSPVVRQSRISIVDYKRDAAKLRKPLWMRIYLDILLLAFSIYTLYTYETIYSSVNLSDPLLFLCSSLFVLACGLIFLRLFPLLMKLLFVVGRALWPPALYVSLTRIIRSRGEERFIMLFLIFTVAIGIFDAKAARTLNMNREDSILHANGADLVVREAWKNNQPPLGIQGPSDGLPPIVWEESDFSKFTEYSYTTSITKVQRTAINAYVPDGKVRGELLAIDTKGFGETAYIRSDLYRRHLFEYLNVLSQNPSAVLVSSEFSYIYGLKLGDHIDFKSLDNRDMNGVICGFVDYWPGHKNIVQIKDETGHLSDTPNLLVVANLNYVQSTWGLTPYEIWIKTDGTTNNPFYGFAEERGLRFALFKDTKSELVSARNDPQIQSTNGVLTLNFLVILFICFTGFLMYWILSIKARVLQFGIFRAMGMPMRGILGMLLNEQLFVSVLSVCVGIGIGELCSALYVPLLKISFDITQLQLPFKIFSYTSDYIQIIGIMVFMLLLCVIILYRLIKRLNVQAALKLGED